MFTRIANEIVVERTLSADSVDFLVRWGCKLARRMVRWATEADIDDIVQTSLLGLSKMIHSYDPDLASVSTLYQRIVTNAAAQWAKKANRLHTVSLDLENDEGESFIDVEDKESESPDSGQIREAVFSCLDDREKQIAVWLGQSMTQEQIAERLDVTRQAVSAAIIKMRGKLERAGFGA